MALRSDINIDDLVIDVNKKNSFKLSELNKVPIVIFIVVVAIALAGFLSFRTINAQNTAQAQEEFETIRAEYKKKGVTYTFNDYETDVATYRKATKKLAARNAEIPTLKDFVFSGNAGGTLNTGSSTYKVLNELYQRSTGSYGTDIAIENGNLVYPEGTPEDKQIDLTTVTDKINDQLSLIKEFNKKQADDTDSHYHDVVVQMLVDVRNNKWDDMLDNMPTTTNEDGFNLYCGIAKEYVQSKGERYIRWEEVVIDKNYATTQYRNVITKELYQVPNVTDIEKDSSKTFGGAYPATSVYKATSGNYNIWLDGSLNVLDVTTN